MYGTKVMPSYFTSFIADFKYNYAKLSIFFDCTEFLFPLNLFFRMHRGAILIDYRCINVNKSLYINVRTGDLTADSAEMGGCGKFFYL